MRIERGTSDDLDSVMEVMDAAFGDRFGEAWTRSQCAGILPMAGVSLMLARDATAATPIGFSLFRTVADEAELLLLAVLPSHHRRGIGRHAARRFHRHARATTASTASISKCATAIRPSPCIGPPVSRRLGGAATITMRRDGARFDALTFAREL